MAHAMRPHGRSLGGGLVQHSSSLEGVCSGWPISSMWRPCRHRQAPCSVRAHATLASQERAAAGTPSSFQPPAQFTGGAAGGGGKRWSAPSPEARRQLSKDSLINRLKGSVNLEALSAQCRDARLAMGPAELAVAFNQLARVSEPQRMTARDWAATRALVRELMGACEHCLHRMSGAELLYVVAALAKLRASPQQAWLNRFLAISRTKLGNSGPGHLTIFLRALAKLDLDPWDIKSCIAFPAWMHHYCAEVRSKLPKYSAYELSRTVGCLAELGYKPDKAFMDELGGAVREKMGGFDSAALARIMASFAALKYEPDKALMRAYYEEVYHKLPLFDDRDLATALCAFSSLKRLMAVDFIREFLEEVVEKLPTFSPSPLGNVLLALGRLQYRPEQTWTDKVADHVQTNMWRFSGPAMASAAWGLARTGYEPPAAFVEELLKASHTKLRALRAQDYVHLIDALASWRYSPAPGSAAAARLDRWFEAFTYAADKKRFGPREAVELLQACAALGLTPDRSVVNNLLQQLRQCGLNHAPAVMLSDLISCLAALGHDPGPAFLQHYCTVTRYWWTALSPSNFGTIMAALGRMGHAPVPCGGSTRLWVMELLAQMHCQVQNFDARAISGALWGVARLTEGLHLPSKKWLTDFGAQTASVMASATAEQLAQMLWGLVRMGHKPDEVWMGAWEARAVHLVSERRAAASLSDVGAPQSDAVAVSSSSSSSSGHVQSNNGAYGISGAHSSQDGVNEQHSSRSSSSTTSSTSTSSARHMLTAEQAREVQEAYAALSRSLPPELQAAISSAAAAADGEVTVQVLPALPALQQQLALQWQRQQQGQEQQGQRQQSPERGQALGQLRRKAPVSVASSGRRPRGWR